MSIDDNLENSENTQSSVFKSKNGVLNLSKKALSNPQQSILEKGLKFCPTQTSVDLA